MKKARKGRGGSEGRCPIVVGKKVFALQAGPRGRKGIQLLAHRTKTVGTDEERGGSKSSPLIRTREGRKRGVLLSEAGGEKAEGEEKNASRHVGLPKAKKEHASKGVSEGGKKIFQN